MMNLDCDEQYIYDENEHAISVLHGEYPDAPLVEINLAVMTDWDESRTDEENVETCRYLEECV